MRDILLPWSKRINIGSVSSAVVIVVASSSRASSFCLLSTVTSAAQKPHRRPCLNGVITTTSTTAIVQSSKSSLSNNNMSDDDEFGDCNFLGDVDFNNPAIAAPAAKRGITDIRPNGLASTNVPAMPFYKRSKISVSPARKVPSPPPPIKSKGGSATAEVVSHLQRTLQQYFGYETFRKGQLEVVQNILQHQRDVAVFWATGQGKSLCYQIPALVHPQNIAVVVSPLISLMQDQVHKLNGLQQQQHSDGAELATFLGSGQTDSTVEQRALAGEYRVIYVTPEKLLSGDFLDRLSGLHTASHHNKKKIAVIAIDEAHCVSEWGFDFRPKFRQVGNALRRHPVLSRIPILALTATAVPRVQQDICDSLQLRNPFVAKQTFDRTNLKIRVLKKSGIPAAMKDLLAELNASGVRAAKQSTIVYAPTRAQVDDIALYLQTHVRNEGMRVEAYHAGLSNDGRGRAHTNFLTGQTTVIVATVAFGMGIDKPDTRRVIHYGCPKTLEEYYQQIGRAGRDGLPAECVMYVAETDFDRYKSDFYLGGLTGMARQATESSMAALRSYSLNSEICRRKALLNYFNEIPSFGERCGTCDTCRNVATYGPDAQRDFGPLGARVVLQAIDSLDKQGISNIIKILAGSVVEDYRYKRGKNPSTVQKEIESGKENLPKKYPQSYFRDLIGPLTQNGYLTESTQTFKNSIGFDRTWTVYSLTTKGGGALSQKVPILLPVPESIRQIEKQEEEKRQKVLAQLERNGIKQDKLPREEVESGDGEVIRAYTKWHTYLENLQKSGKDDRVAQMESLVLVIENWRSATAIKQRMAPASVLAEHRLISIAYTAATMPPGVKLQAASLEAAGVRTREIGSLVAQLGAWVERMQPAPTVSKTPTTKSAPMVLSKIATNKVWQYAVYKPQKKTGMTAWEQSYARFDKGESPQTIAMTPTNGRQPIQVKTVVGHILDAIVQGRSVDMTRLVEYMPAPTQDDWEQLKQAEVTTGMDVTGDPNTSGKDGEKFLMTDLLRPIVGNRVADLPFTERSEAEKEDFLLWCDRLKWYMALCRAGYEPRFHS